jgi:hypothetical protein
MSLSRDSNLFLTPDASGDTLMQLRPSFEAAYESPTREIYGFASLDAQVSSSYSALNSLGARRNANVEARVRTAPSVFLGLGARYDRTDSPADLNFDSGVLLGRQKARRSQLTPSMSYRLRPRAMVTAQYDWTQESLSRGIPQSLHSARAGVYHDRSARTQVGARYIARAFVSSQIDRQYSHTLLGTWMHQMAPGTNLSIQVGPRVRSYGGITSEVLATFLRGKPRRRFLLDYWHGETIVLGVPGPVDVHSGSNRLSWLLRNDLEVSTLVGVFRSETLNEVRAIVYHGGVGGAWSFGQMYMVTATYSVDYQIGDLRRPFPSDEHLRRGVLLAGLTVAPRLTRSSRPPSLDPSLPMTGVLRP